MRQKLRTTLPTMIQSRIFLQVHNVNCIGQICFKYACYTQEVVVVVVSIL